jgi:hypothetical protein
MTAAGGMPTRGRLRLERHSRCSMTPGPGMVTHVWVTIASDDPNHLKALVLRMYWDGETTPSVEAPIGDFFGLGLGDYHLYQSIPLSGRIGQGAEHCFFPMPFQKHARITVTNEGTQSGPTRFISTSITALTAKPLPADSLYFHAQYRQAAPNMGPRMSGSSNGDMDNERRIWTATAITYGWKRPGADILWA